MPFLDSTSITGGYGQSISDWPVGDDRIFSGTITGLASSDPNLTDAYFTLKLNPNDVDADAIIQKHITQSLTTAGQITQDASLHYTVLSIHVFSGDYEGLVSVGTSYWWDFRVITTSGSTITVATGQVTFLQQVTQTNKAGTPAALPNFGQPRIRGFNPQSPQLMNPGGTFNAGDIYFNQNPQNGNGVGWQCTVGGAPGTWVAFSALSAGLNDSHFKGYTASEPVSGVGFVAADYFLNSAPAAAGPEGWVYTGSVWLTKGIIGDS